jgi:DNA-binding LacI/PurR family transcriptional regulator
LSRPNLEDVAARAGVSRATVSRVVNGHTSVAPELRERVQRAVDQLGYVPHQAARSLMNRRTDAIALLASESDIRVFGDPFYSGIVRGITQEVNRAGLQLILLMAQTDDDLDRAKQFLRSGSMDAVMLISERSIDDPVPGMLERLGIPYVIGGRPLQPGLAAAYVDNDNVFGSTMAARHLASLGRSAIGTIAGPADMCAGIDRLTGFKKGLGRAFRAARVEQGDFTSAGGQAATERLLQRVPDLDGLFAASDLTALGALIALRAAGRRVPEDVALVGFDDNDFAAATDPPLTTVRQDPVLMGRTMVRLYLARHRPDIVLPPDDLVPNVEGVDHVVLPVHLIVRESA